MCDAEWRMRDSYVFFEIHQWVDSSKYGGGYFPGKKRLKLVQSWVTISRLFNIKSNICLIETVISDYFTADIRQCFKSNVEKQPTAIKTSTVCAWYLSPFKLTYAVLNYGEFTNTYSSWVHFKLTVLKRYYLYWESSHVINEPSKDISNSHNTMED